MVVDSALSSNERLKLGYYHGICIHVMGGWTMAICLRTMLQLASPRIISMELHLDPGDQWLAVLWRFPLRQLTG